MLYIYSIMVVGLYCMCTAEGVVESCCMCTGRVVLYVYRRGVIGLYCMCTEEGL